MFKFVFQCLKKRIVAKNNNFNWLFVSFLSSSADIYNFIDVILFTDGCFNGSSFYGTLCGKNNQNFCIKSLINQLKIFNNFIKII